MKRRTNWKKCISGLLATAMALTVFPFSAMGIGVSDVEAATGSDAATSTNAVNRVTPDAEASYEPYKGMNEWKDRKSYKAGDNAYVMTVASGATAGDKVLYFAVHYKDNKGVSNIAFIFPHVDAKERSDSMLNYYSDGNCGLESSYGALTAMITPYQNAELGSNTSKTMQEWQVEDFAFETVNPISDIESIDIYLERGQWTIQGLSIYKVEEYKGYEEYGLMSGESFLDFKGYMIADVDNLSGDSSLTIGTNDVDEVITIGGSYPKAKLVSYSDKAKTRDFATNDSLYTMRMDIADTVEASMKMYQNDALNPMSQGFNYEENLAVDFQYTDIHGWTRKVTLPIMASSYTQAMMAEPNAKVMGFAQRGDTICFQGLFPEFASIIGRPTLYVGNEAQSALSSAGFSSTGMSASGSYVSKAVSMMNTVEESIMSLFTGIGRKKTKVKVTGDNVYISGMSFYKGGVTPYVRGGKYNDLDGNTEHVEGAKFEYAFESKDPIYYFTTTELKGHEIDAGKSDAISLLPFNSSSSGLLPKDFGNDIFLVMIDTSSKTGAGFSGDVEATFFFENMEGSMTRTLPYSVKDGAEDYMGRWPAKDKSSYLQNNAFVEGGTVAFLIKAENLRQFTGAELTINGKNVDERWTMNNLRIYYIERYDPRSVYIKDFTGDTDADGSKFWLERSVISSPMFIMRGSNSKVFDPNGNDMSGFDSSSAEQMRNSNGDLLTDANGNPVYKYDTLGENDGEYTFQSGNKYNIKFNGTGNDTRDKSYKDVRFKMSYDDTQTDWGFTKAKKTYIVAVDVAADPNYDNGNGDSGSKNHFYFQLGFSNGSNSGYVLANQQISADGFRSGITESFAISVNQDYGELTKLRIIPEDTSNDSEPFDKLNISKVAVSEQTSGGSYTSFIFDNIGWIDIDFRDELESASSRGQRARTAEELAHEFKVSYKQKVPKLLCEMTLDPPADSYDPFVGSVKAKINYIRESDGAVREFNFDVVEQLESYLDNTAKFTEVESQPFQKSIDLTGTIGRVSDPATMFRPSHTDRFVIPPIPDLKAVVSMEFWVQTRNDVEDSGNVKNAYWDIKNISISQIIKSGALQLASNGEYIRNMTVQGLYASTNHEEGEILPGIATKFGPITFNQNELTWKTDEWATPVSRVPESTSDTVNIYVYPSDDSRDVGASVGVRLIYNIPFSQYRYSEDKNLRAAKDSNGKILYYYVKGLNAADMVSAGALRISSVNDEMGFNHAIVQQIKDGVVVSTYNYNFFDASAVRGTSAQPLYTNTWLDDTKETFAIQFGAGTEDQDLIPINHDVAIAINYTSTIDGGTTVYQSPYVYLTDLGYKRMHEGLFAEIPYDVSYVDEITGYSIVAYGDLSGNVECAGAEVYTTTTTPATTAEGKPKVEKTRRSYSSFKTSHALTGGITTHARTSNTMLGENSVAPVEIAFTTADAKREMESGTDSAVRMALNYTDYNATTRTVKYQDITNYIVDGTSEFRTGETQSVKFFLPEMKQLAITSATISPYNAWESDATLANSVDTTPAAPGSMTTVDPTSGANSGANITTTTTTDQEIESKIIASLNATWTISDLRVNMGFGEKEYSRELNQTFSGLYKDEENIIRLSESAAYLVNVMKGSESYTPVDNLVQVAAKPGELLSITVRGGSTTDSTGGYSVSAYKMVGEAASPLTDNSINGVIGGLMTSSSFTFTAPANETENVIVYKIVISPVAAPDMKTTIMVSVEKGSAAQTLIPGAAVEKTTEATTEKTTESTTEATTEASTDSTTPPGNDGKSSDTNGNKDTTPPDKTDDTANQQNNGQNSGDTSGDNSGNTIVP